MAVVLNGKKTLLYRIGVLRTFPKLGGMGIYGDERERIFKIASSFLIESQYVADLV